MKLRELEQYLQDINDFPNPKINLEQYKTRPHLAACLLHNAQTQFEDITDKTILDIGCGTGCLSIGAVMLGAEKIHGVDVDVEALEVFRENVEEFGIEEDSDDDDDDDEDSRESSTEVTDRHTKISDESDDNLINLYLGHVNIEGHLEPKIHDEPELDSQKHLRLLKFSRLKKLEETSCIDTVLMNPPFGTKKKGIDVAFLKAALR